MGRMSLNRVAIAVALSLATASGAAAARTPDTASANEARTAARLDAIAASPPRLRIFLAALPKGADLHNHGGGAIYAEDFLDWAGKDGLCVTTDSLRIAPPPCTAPNTRPAAGLERNYPLYSNLIDSLSTRGFEEGVNDPKISGYNRFFSTFDRFFLAAGGRMGDLLALTRQQAAASRVSYVELSTGAEAGGRLAAQMGDSDAVTPADFPALMRKVEPLLPAAVASARADYDRFEAKAAQIDGCASGASTPSCATEMRYLYTALRTIAPERVFAHMALGFALADADPRFVGVNIAAPEHDPIAVRDYALHMQMFGFLKARHPQVPLSLHAGELTLGLVHPRALTFHIRDAIDVAGARRIGHGIDIPYEANAPALLSQMARARIAVEINLTSNAVILGVKGAAHPLSLYREAGVPVVLSTDDEGVSRGDMTNEYMRAVTEQGLRYRDLKQIVRDSLEYSFLPGASLWQDRAGGARAPACTDLAAPACTAMVATSARAAQQVRLERDLIAFEAEMR